MSTPSSVESPRSEDGRAYDGFLSHNTRDKPAVERIDTHLRALGLHLWLDVRELGDEWHGPMQDAIDQVPACVVLFGPNGWGKWQQREAQLADARHVEDAAFRVIPVLLPGVTDEFLASLPRWVSQYRYIDFRSGLDDPEHLEELRNRLLGISGEDETADDTRDAVENPYQGLDAFDGAHAQFFYGRDADITRLLQKIQGGRFLAVLGASGSGKSSVVLAGLLPRLQAGALPGSAGWRVQVLRPGANPLAALAQAATLLSANQAVHRTLDDLADDARTLDGLTGLILAEDRKAEHVLWVVDQAEEMFTLCSDEENRSKFLANLTYAATSSGGGALVILTMRADFYGHCALYPDLSRLLEANQYLVGPLDAEGLRQAIVQPSGQLGRTFETGLVETILDDVRQQPGALPLLQYALRELWDRQQGRMLTLRGYRDTGGVAGALAKRADATYEGLTPEQQKIARSTLLQLTQPHEGMDATRRRAAFRQLVPNEGARQAVETVVQELVAARLLTTDRQANEEYVDVAHEALIRNWTRLRDWVEEDSGGLRLLHQLQDAAQEWRTRGRAEEDLWRGAKLAQIAEWQTQHQDMLSEEARDFLEAGAASRDREVRELEERRERELRTAQQIAADAQRISRERRKQTIILAAGLVVALLVGALALFQKTAADRATFQADQNAQQADQQREGRLTELVAAQALDRLDQRDLSLVLGAEASERSGGDTAEIQRSLLAGLTASPALTRFLNLPADQRTDWVGSVAFSPDGKLLAVGGDNGAIMLWDTASNTLVDRPLNRQSGRIWSVAFSPDGQTLASASADNSIVLWDVAARQPRGAPLQGHSGPVHSVAFRPDGAVLASGAEDNTVRLWDPATGGEIGQPLRGHTSTVRAVAFSPDGTRLASGSDDGTIRVWNPATGESQSLGGTSADPLNSGIWALAFSPDLSDPVLAAAGLEGTYTLWDLSTGKMRGTPVTVSETPTPVLSVVFDSSGRFLYTGSVDKTIAVWAVKTGTRIDRWTGQGGWVTGVALSPTTSLVASGGSDGSVMLWNGPDHHPLWDGLAARQTVPVATLAFPPNGTSLIAGTTDGTTETWNLSNGNPISLPAPFQESPVLVRALAFSPDTSLMAVSSFAGTSTIWDTTSHSVLTRLDTGSDYFPATIAFSLQGHFVASGGCANRLKPICDAGEVRLWDAPDWHAHGQPFGGLSGAVRDLTFSPDEKLLASISATSEVTLWDVATGQRVGQPLAVGSAYAMAVAFSPDSSTLGVAGADGTIRLMRVTDGQQVGASLSRSADGISTLAFSADGTALVAGNLNGDVARWDLATDQSDPLPLSHTSSITAVVFSRDGRVIAAADNSGFTSLWDSATGQVLHNNLLATGAGVTSVSYSSDGQVIASGTTGGIVQIWDVASKTLAAFDQVPQVNVDAVAFTPQQGKRTLAISSSSSSAFGLWDDPSPGSGPTWHATSVIGGGLVFAPDGNTLATGGCGQFTTLVQCGQGAVQLWDVATGDPKGTPLLGGNGWVTSVAFSPDGQRVAAGTAEGTILQWDVATGQLVGQPLYGPNMGVLTLAFSPDGKILAAAGRDNDIYLWDPATGQALGQPLKGHTNSVLSLAFSPDGKVLASGATDITIRLWDVATHLQIGALPNETAWVTSVVFKPGDSHTLAGGSTDGYVAFWDLDPSSWRQRACAIAGRDLTPEEWHQYLGDEPYHATCSSLGVGN